MKQKRKFALGVKIEALNNLILRDYILVVMVNSKRRTVLAKKRNKIKTFFQAYTQI